MMSKKLKVFILIMVTLVLLTAGSAATVMAQDEPIQDEQTQEEVLNPGLELKSCFSKTALLDKVAELLDITPEELVEILKQAKQELCYESFIDYIEKAAEEGIISPEEAAEIIKWWEDKPEAVDKLLPWLRTSAAMRIRQRCGDFMSIKAQLSYNKNNAQQFKTQLKNRINAASSSAQRLQISNALRIQQQIAACK